MAKIAIIILLACGMFGLFSGVFINGILAIGLLILTLLLALLLYLATKKSYDLLKCGWMLWLLFYVYLRYATGIRFWWIFLPWIYRNGLEIHALIAWAEAPDAGSLDFLHRADLVSEIQEVKKLKIKNDLSKMFHVKHFYSGHFVTITIFL